MELRLVNGDYVADIFGGFEAVVGAEEKLERVLYKLLCRRGGFAPMPELGSRLYLLLSEKKEQRSTAARKYILEALENESELTLTDVQVSAAAEGLLVKAEFEYVGEAAVLTVHLS